MGVVSVSPWPTTTSDVMQSQQQSPPLLRGVFPVTRGSGGAFSISTRNNDLLSQLGLNKTIKPQSEIFWVDQNRSNSTSHSSGYGIYDGIFIGARTLNRIVQSAEEGEAMTALEAVKWASCFNTNWSFECDNKSVMKALQGTTVMTSWRSTMIIKECLTFSSTADRIISFLYNPRSTNMVADCLAKYVRASLLSAEWTCLPPTFLRDHINNDLLFARPRPNTG